MSEHTQTALTGEQLDEIDTRAASLHEYATLTDKPFQVEADQLTGVDVPALLAEVRRLSARCDEVIEGRNEAAIELGKAARKTIAKATEQRDQGRRIAVTLEQETAQLEARVAELEAERKKYVGAEPTIADEMAYLGRCLNAVYDLCTEAKRSGSLGITPEAVEQAADGEWTAATPRPALPWAHVMDDGDLHGFLNDLVSAAIHRWHSDPDVPDRDVLHLVEKACADWRTPGQGYRSDEPGTGERR